jgi:hypothetical protein
VWEYQSRAKYLSKEKLTQRVMGNVTYRAHVWHGTLSLGTLGCLSAPGDNRVDNKHLSLPFLVTSRCGWAFIHEGPSHHSMCCNDILSSPAESPNPKGQTNLIYFEEVKPISHFEVKHKIEGSLYLEINSIIYRISSHCSWRSILLIELIRYR